MYRQHGTNRVQLFTKNIPAPNVYKIKLHEKIECVLKRIRWKIFYFIKKRQCQHQQMKRLRIYVNDKPTTTEPHYCI